MSQRTGNVRSFAHHAWSVPFGGQIDGMALTGWPGFRRMEVHGSTSHTQHLVQASGRAGVPWRRGAPRTHHGPMGAPARRWRRCNFAELGSRQSAGGGDEIRIVQNDEWRIAPSSRESRFTVGAHCAINREPTRVVPVNESLQRVGLAQSSAPIS